MTYWNAVSTLVPAVGLFAFLRARRAVVLSCTDLLRRLHPFQLRGLSHYLDPDEPYVDAALFQRAGGYTGLYMRWRNRVILLQLCQISRGTCGITDADMAFVVAQAAQLTWLSVQSFALQPFAAIAPAKAQQAASQALLVYASLADSIYTFFANADERACNIPLAALL